MASRGEKPEALYPQLASKGLKHPLLIPQRRAARITTGKRGSRNKSVPLGPCSMLGVRGYEQSSVRHASVPRALW